MAKGKRTKEQTTIYKTLHRKQKIEQYKNPTKNTGGGGGGGGVGGELRCSRMVSSSCSTSATHRITVVKR